MFALERAIFFSVVAIAILAMLVSCKTETGDDIAFAKADSAKTTTAEKRNLSQEWKDYWYAGVAEISSYKLDQARYGELRAGTAALIYVTEDFLPKKQVKADAQNDSNIPVLKLNATKKFVTGIYPYSIMTSTFYPVTEKKHAIKVSQSTQEWCGHVYAQLNNRENFEVTSHSYFQSEADQEMNLPKDILENELWTQIRLDPTSLPTGSFKAIPNLEFIRNSHIDLAAYQATGSLNEGSYTIEYPELKRTVNIQFTPEFPHTIEGWTETFPQGRDGALMTTTATKMKTIKSAYWGKKSIANEALRTELQLD
ncbi:septum formation inhibitor Maf [Dokdonia donghaensis DSW-1]|uniref:Septum formation inhibitor Maf n=2 Tax=Dokdonia TaxID=326319 RepID=A0A0A2GXK2_9FLAO|nr:septum formation inhibitor Maf [Dokdonia donghaensis DSW-1]